jgi:uncharacterized protein YjaZ
MRKLDKILLNVIDDAKSIDIPISDKIEPTIYIDKNRYDRVAACYRYPYPLKYEIYLSPYTLYAKDSEIKNIIAHEVLHTCFLSMDHDMPWSIYIKRMNDKLGYNIQQKYEWNKIIKHK